MKTLRAAVTVLLALPPLATAQPVADHLKCYKVKDPAVKKLYTADLGGLVAEPGCTIKVPATMACVPATKENVQPGPPGGGGMGMPNAFACYKIKCPRRTLPPLALNDQFGSRSATPILSKLLCAPLAPPTTTTSTTATTTSTTAPPGCPDGCLLTTYCEFPQFQNCVLTSTCVLATCARDSDCLPGQRCAGDPTGCAAGGTACCSLCP